MIYLLKMVMFYSHVSLQEGIYYSYKMFFLAS